MFPLPEPMRLALDAARGAAAAGAVPVGGGRVVAGWGVGRRAGAAGGGRERLAGCDLGVTLAPCAMCAGAIAHARIARLYYGASDPKGGAVEHGPRFFAQPTCHHRPDVYGGIGEEEAAAMLRGFFAVRR